MWLIDAAGVRLAAMNLSCLDIWVVVQVLGIRIQLYRKLDKCEDEREQRRRTTISIHE